MPNTPKSKLQQQIGKDQNQELPSWYGVNVFTKRVSRAVLLFVVMQSLLKTIGDSQPSRRKAVGVYPLNYSQLQQGLAGRCLNNGSSSLIVLKNPGKMQCYSSS